MAYSKELLDHYEVKRLRSLSPLWEMAQEGVDISKIKWASH